MNLIHFLDRGHLINPLGKCLVTEEGTLDYSEVWRASHRIANRLRTLKLEDGAIIAVLSPNHLYTLVATLAILRAGYIWLPVNARHGGDEIAHTLRVHEASFLFHHSMFSTLISSLAPKLPALRGQGLIDKHVQEDDLHGSASLLEWINTHDDTLCEITQDADAVIAIRSTSGTTGPSKGVMVTNRNYATMYANMLAMLPMPDQPVHLAVAPLSHAAGALCFPTMAFGGVNVILSKTDPDSILSSIEHHCVTHLFLPPTLIYSLLDAPCINAYNYSSLRYLIYSAAPMSVERLKEALHIFGPVMTQAYGQAESPFFCTILTPREHLADLEKYPKRLSSCGRATPFTNVAVMDDDGKLLDNGQTGEIVVRGDLVMKGYFGNEKATQAVSKFGWHHTGDLGYQDDEGYFYLVDRKRDIIISGGFNIYPGEIEQVLFSHPAVSDCAVIGVPDRKWGESVKAIVQCKPGLSVTQEQLIQLCEQRLGKLKTPKSIEFWVELPRSPVGKVLKKEIRLQFWKDQERNI